MNSPQNVWRKTVMYSTAPEMRLFWISLIFLIGGSVFIISVLPAGLAFAGVGFFFILAVLVLVSGLRLALSSLEVNTQHSQLDGIIKNLSVGVIFYDPDFRVRIFNRAAEKIFGLKAGDIIGQLITPQKAQDSSTRLLAQVIFPSLAPKLIKRSDVNVYPQVLDLSFEEPELELRVITTPLIDDYRRTVGFVKLVTDHTRETELLRSKNSFITIAAHQLRTPLTGITWAFENLLKDQSRAVESKDMLESGLKAAQKLERIVSNLLDVAKIEEGKFGYQFESQDLIPFIETMLADAAQLAAIHNIKVFFERPQESSIPLSFDPAKLGMALSNILDNTIKYNIKNGQVTVNVERMKDKPFVKVTIKDTGVGIPGDQIQNLFKKFFRADNAIKFQTEGTGLGLFIARNIIRRHGGDIWAESELNRGTTIYFTLPTDPSLIPPEEPELHNQE